MNYKLDNTPISEYGAIPSPASGHLALTGILDLPKRIGKTEHDWGISIEPFVQAEDIELDGRTLTLNVAVKEINLNAFKAACVACTELSFDYDTFQVIQKDEITVQEVGGYCKVLVPFWQNEVGLSAIAITPSETGEYRIDNFNFVKDFGIYIGQSNNLLNTAKRIEVATTEFYTKTDYRGIREITLPCSMLSNSFADAYYKMNQFQSILMAPGLRQLNLQNFSASVYFKNGITVNVISPKVLQFNLKAVCP